MYHNMQCTAKSCKGHATVFGQLHCCTVKLGLHTYHLQNTYAVEVEASKLQLKQPIYSEGEFKGHQSASQHDS